MKIGDLLDKKTPTIEEISKKHNVDIDLIKKELEMGIEVEKEHTSNDSLAKEIALDHLNELPDYYTRLKTVEEK